VHRRRSDRRTLLGRHGAALLGILAILLISGAAAVGLVRSHQHSQTALEDRYATRTALAAAAAQTYVTQLMGAEHRAAELSLTGTTSSFQTVVDTFGFTNAVLLDARGRVLAVHPAKPGLIGQELASRYTHLAAALSGKRAISPVVPAASNGAPVVAFAVPFDTPSGRRVFSGAFEVRTTPLRDYLEALVSLPTSRVFLIDGQQNVLTASVATTSGSTLGNLDPALAAALQPNHLGRYGDQLYVSRPVVGTPWLVVAAISHQAVIAPVAGSGQYVPWVILAGLVLSAFMVWGLLLRRRADNHRLVETLRSLDRVARQDGLTGAQTRRSTAELLASAQCNAERDGTWLSVLMLDVDFFKRINDTFGHAAGDEALIAVAERLRVCLRTTDVFGRWGGEEFLVVLPDADPASAEQTAERLRESVEQADIGLGQGGDVIGVTISVGVASSTGASPEVLIHSADRAMYAAKAAGRNQVRTATLPSSAVIR
jgi:diguanylate cyclase (GGDEF)-like protein